jgi:rubrerythrin
MTIDAKLQPHEILAAAIRSEIEAADFYAGILAKVKNILLQQKLGFLVSEEKKHRRILETLYAQRFPGVELKVPPSLAPPPAPPGRTGPATVLDLFKIALGAEKRAELFYRDGRSAMTDPGSRKMLEYLSRVERSHYFLIKSEIDLLARFPDYYDVEDFHMGQDLFHIGP